MLAEMHVESDALRIRRMWSSSRARVCAHFLVWMHSKFPTHSFRNSEVLVIPVLSFLAVQNCPAVRSVTKKSAASVRTAASRLKCEVIIPVSLQTVRTRESAV